MYKKCTKHKAYPQNKYACLTCIIIVLAESIKKENTMQPAPEKLQNGRDIIIDWFLKVSTYNLE